MSSQYWNSLVVLLSNNMLVDLDDYKDIIMGSLLMLEELCSHKESVKHSEWPQYVEVFLILYLPLIMFLEVFFFLYCVVKDFENPEAKTEID